MNILKHIYIYLIIGIIAMVGLQLLISNIFPSDLSFMIIDKDSGMKIENERIKTTLYINNRDSLVKLENIAKHNAVRLRFSDQKTFKGDYYTIFYKDEKGRVNTFNVGYTKSGCTMLFDMDLLGNRIKQHGFKYSKSFINDSLGIYLSVLFNRNLE